MPTLVEEVFVTEGVPQFTFVPPPNFNEILLDIRHPGKPVIIEGQSGTGKTTCVKKILEQLESSKQIDYLTAREAVDVDSIRRVASQRPTGIFVVDDFHRLDKELQEELANLAKLSAEQASGVATLPKLVLIGINQVGSDLIQLVPNIAKRTGIHRIKSGTEDEIRKLVEAGCEALNIRIRDCDLIFGECRGDFWLTQQLCQSICTMNDVLHRSDTLRSIEFDLSMLRQRVVDKLRAAYYPAVKEFCRGRRFRPSNDPYYKLLRLASQQESSVKAL